MYCQSPSQASASANQEVMSAKEQQQQHTGTGRHAAALYQHQDNIIIRHLNQDNALSECQTMSSTGVESTSPAPIQYHTHRFVASASRSPVDYVTQQQQIQQSLGANVSNNNSGASASPLTREPVVSSWSSTLDGREFTPTTSLMGPVEVRCQSREGVVCNEQEHRMMVDGDSLTLVILDCSPSPCHNFQQSSSSIGQQQVSAASTSSGNYQGSSNSYMTSSNSDQQQQRSCDCFNRCYCQTELIIRQNLIPLDHICQHVCQTQTPFEQQQQKQSRNQQQVAPNRPLAIEHSYENNEFRQESEIQRSQQRGYQYQDHQNYLHPKPSPSPSGSSFQNQPQQRNYQYQRQETEASREQEPIYKMQQPTVYGEEGNVSNQQLNQETTSTTTTTYERRDDQRQVQPHPYADSQLQQQPPTDIDISLVKQNHEQEQQQQQPRPGKRLVKRWNWNKQEFVMSEVDDEPSPKPQVAPPPPPPPTHVVASSQSQEAWRQLEQSMSPLPGTSQYNPSWTAYRVPDIESVQTDPIYSDLMQELQRLEEGTPVIKESAVEPETFSRPVFGQSITPEYIEVEEYENVEFVCRLIPQSDPSMRIEWTVNGKPLQESNRYTNEHDFGVVRLKIKRCEAEDSGIYQCRAINSIGEAISTASLRVHGKSNVQCETLNPAGLDKIRQLENPKPVDQVEEQVVQQPPKFISHIQDYVEKAEGESVHFECCLNPVDDPDLKTEWFFNGRPLVTGSRFHTIDDFGFIVLDIDWLFPRDTGEYVCRATNKYGTDLTRTVLRVKPDKNIILESQLDNPMLIDKLRQLEFPDVEQEVLVEEPDKPARFVQHLCSEGNRRQFLEGDNVHFEARVGPATDGNLTVEWFHNDKPLISGHRFKPSFDFGHIQLDILYVYAEDSGVYKCVARNAAGEDSSRFEIKVTGKPSLVYQSQLPKEMVGGVQKITDMEAMWNRPPDPEEEPEPEERQPPEFVLKPKPCVAFEGSCARFSCRVVANPRPRVVWTLNGQTVVTGSRYKLTHDGMYHLTIPKCQLSDAGKVEVHARNLVGECYCTTELKVKRKVDDYRGVLKNSPNPWYDEQSLKIYQRQRSQELTDDEDYGTFIQQQQLKLQMATEHRASSPSASGGPGGLQVIGYMEPGTPDVNLLATTPNFSQHSSQPPLVEPGDLHPVVVEQQIVMAPAPSTIKRALSNKDKAKTPSEVLFHQATTRTQEQRQQQSRRRPQQQEATDEQHLGREQRQQEQQLQRKQQQQRQQQQQVERQHVYGLDLPRYSSNQKVSLQQQRYQTSQQYEQSASGEGQQEQISSEPDQRGLYSRQQQQQQRQQHYSQQQLQRYQEQQAEYQSGMKQQQARNEKKNASGTSNSSSQQFDSRLPPPSPESTVHGHEVHSHTHKQLQKEHRANREILREIIEKEIFEQEHKGVTKESPVRGSSIERGGTPTKSTQQRLDEQKRQQQQQMLQQQQQQKQQKQQEQRRVRFQQELEEQQQMEHEEHMVQIEDYMVPPEFIHKIQPCQALDGDQGRFECTFKGEPKPTITWYRESNMIKPSNLYSIETDLNECKSVLVIKRVTVNSNAVFTVKAENQAGSAKSSANLVVETHPLPEARLIGVGCSIDAPEMISSAQESGSSSMAAGGAAMVATSSASSSSQQQQFRTGASSSSSYSMSTSTSTVASGSGGGSGQQQQQRHQQQMEQSSRTRQESPKIKSVITRKLSNEEMVSLIRASPEGMIAPTFLHTIHDTYTKPGELARLDARLLGTQPMEVRWLKDGQRVRADRLHKMVLEGDLYTLLILECSLRDEGTYECIASNRIGEARCEGHLFVSDGRPPSAIGARAPDLMTSYSTSANSQQLYQQSEQQAVSASSSSLHHEQQQQQQEQQQKQYYGLSRHQYNPLMAQYTSNKEAASHQQVQQIAPKLIKRLENQQTREGKSVTLRCQISSFPLAEVHWYKENNQLIKPSKYFRIFKDNDETYCLKILETFPEDQGEYKCVAKAPTGHSQVETKATITVIPNSPK